VAEFKNRFGFEWLKDEEGKPNPRVAPAAPPPLPAGMEEALLAYSRPILETLKRSPGATNEAFEVAKQVKARFDVIIRVLDYLAGKGYLERVAEDPQGNDTVRLTGAGEKLLA
jgi:hypothetical protein